MYKIINAFANELNGCSPMGCNDTHTAEHAAVKVTRGQFFTESESQISTGDFHARDLQMTPKGHSRSKVMMHFY